MAWRNDGRVLVLVHTSAPPARAEWEHYVRDVKRIGGGADRRVLVRSYGGSPDGAQRKLLTDVEPQQVTPSAVMTNAALARAVATAISWFIPRLKVFGINGFEPACDFLELSPPERRQARATLIAIESELGIHGSRAAPHEASSLE